MSTATPEAPATAATPSTARREGVAPIITARSLSRTYSHEGVQQHVLVNLDLDIADGEFTVIMGPSGAGKSTLMHVLSGMDAPSLGQVVVDGQELTDLGPSGRTAFRRTRCGFVFQQVHLLDGLSVMDNVLAVGLLAGRRREVVARARSLFERVGIAEDTQRKFPGMLSGGEAQRVAVVRALINEPAVVFADEPTGQLNSEYSRQVLDLLSDLNAGGQSIVMVTHDLRSALRGHTVLYLRDGSVQGTCRLGDWAGDDEQRRDQLTDFLTRMGW